MLTNICIHRDVYKYVISIEANYLIALIIFKFPYNAIIITINATLLGKHRISFSDLPNINISETCITVSYSIPFYSLFYNPSKNQYIHYPK